MKIKITQMHTHFPQLYIAGNVIDANIKNYTLRCQECIKKNRPTQQPHGIPEGPWRKVTMNYFNFKGKQYILIYDYFSKSPFLF